MSFVWSITTVRINFLNEICKKKTLNSTNKTDICSYNVGGLLFETILTPHETYKNVLAGVYSYHHDGSHLSKKCDETRAVFTNVAKYRDWIVLNENIHRRLVSTK